MGQCEREASEAAPPHCPITAGVGRNWSHGYGAARREAVEIFRAF